MVAEGLDDPRKSDTSDHRLARSITSYIKSCKSDDPPALLQQAIPSSTIRWIATQMGSSQHHWTPLTTHLIALAFFFVLRVGEYTKSPEKRRIIPLRKKDICMWHAGIILPNDAPLDVLLTADAATICLKNQKEHGATPHLIERRNNRHGQIRSNVNQRGMIPPRNTPIRTIVDDQDCTLHITSDEIRSAIQITTTYHNLPAHEYSLSCTSSHSIRSGGAMHLKLAGYDNDIIQKLSHWSSNTYLWYIQTQIGQLTAGVAQRMASISLQFHIVA
jgi:hypothetical protein